MLLQLLLLPVLSLAAIHDADVSGVCSVDWDATDDQLALDNSACCDDALHRDLSRSLSRLNQAHAKQAEVLKEVAPLITEMDAHIVATEGVMAISAPGLGQSFCKQRVGAVHVLVQQSPLSDPMRVSLPADRKLACDHAALTRTVEKIIHTRKLKGSLSGAKIIKVFADEIYAAFTTRIWLALSEKRVAFRSNPHLVCEFPVGKKLHLTVFTFQPLPESNNDEDESISAAPSTTTTSPATTPFVPKTTTTVAPQTTVAHKATVSPRPPAFHRTTVSHTATVSTRPIVAHRTTVSSSSHSAFHKVALKVRSEGIFKREVGRARLGGCGNDRLKTIMQRILAPLLQRLEKKLGDIALKLQQVIQRNTGRSFEIMLGKGDLVTSSHQTSHNSHCRLRIGNFYTMVYETPVQYDINNSDLEKRLSNIDFGEKLGGSGFPGQTPFARFDQIITHLHDRRMNHTLLHGIADRLHEIHESRRPHPFLDGPPPPPFSDGPFPPPPFGGRPRLLDRIGERIFG
ncbi:hypothetical protein PRIPAC_81734 [Pristionchus pacificus]|uniref:Uncharacterized protein n=1 Tax=Pristionchus pacificus TaxID=54126 RepID=A0A2A6CKE6_PRIPA|nr:hypothetical protein PRIPAC_81734 [Pristionchus pacificus]|eukprot:PDM78672.1 hypothetical protein PRIPAC_31251 [Pristionchus pacificus]